MAEKVFGRKCEICRRDNFDDRTLGPLIHANNISAHFNCVLYSPVTPDETSLAPKPEDDAIAGLSTRFVRDEGKRAKKLVTTVTQKCQSNYFSLIIFVSVPIFPSITY